MVASRADKCQPSDCMMDFVEAPCGLVGNALLSGGGLRCVGNDCSPVGGTYVNIDVRPGDKNWVSPGDGDPGLKEAGCLVNVGHGALGDMVWCPNWDAWTFKWGGQTQFQITNIDNPSLAFKHTSFRYGDPHTMSAKPQTPFGLAKSLCLLRATNATNGIDGAASTNPSVETGYGVYTHATGTPQLGNQSAQGQAAASAGSGISNNLTYYGTYAGCMNYYGY
jgi:hypothetical protein